MPILNPLKPTTFLLKSVESAVLRWVRKSVVSRMLARLRSLGWNVFKLAVEMHSGGDPSRPDRTRNESSIWGEGGGGGERPILVLFGTCNVVALLMQHCPPPYAVRSTARETRRMAGISSRGQLVTQIDRRSGIHSVRNYLERKKGRKEERRQLQRRMEISLFSNDPPPSLSARPGVREGCCSM